MRAEREADGALAVADLGSRLVTSGARRRERDVRDAAPVAARARAADLDAGAADPPVRVAVDDRHLDGRRVRRTCGGIGLGGASRRRPRCSLAARRSRPPAARRDREEIAALTPRRAPPPPARVPTSSVPPDSSRITCEKNRVITTPSRKSPRRGAGRSPFASASASSGIARAGSRRQREAAAEARVDIGDLQLAVGLPEALDVRRADDPRAPRTPCGRTRSSSRP